jgi:hypothetical protein
MANLVGTFWIPHPQMSWPIFLAVRVPPFQVLKGKKCKVHFRDATVLLVPA